MYINLYLGNIFHGAIIYSATVHMIHALVVCHSMKHNRVYLFQRELYIIIYICSAGNKLPISHLLCIYIYVCIYIHNIHAYIYNYIYINYNVHLLTLARVDAAEGYCNCSVCRQNSSKLTNISTLKILPADVKSYKDQR